MICFASGLDCNTLQSNLTGPVRWKIRFDLTAKVTDEPRSTGAAIGSKMNSRLGSAPGKCRSRSRRWVAIFACVNSCHCVLVSQAAPQSLRRV